MTVAATEREILVKHVMTSPVVTVTGKEAVTKVAEIMDAHRIGSVVVIDEKERPQGIITERDIVTRVIAKKLNPKTVKAEQAMSKPLVTVDPEATVREAARLMNKRNVKRLAVMYKGRLVGILSSKDILAITPELLEVLIEKAKVVAGAPVRPEGQAVVGYCELCGQWSDTLEELNGRFLCEDCVQS
ncbi:MAG: CBS domain-containing protein [Candidatus Bathyarchaeia archaeon]